MTDVSFLDKLEDIPRGSVHTEISDVSLINDCLAVHVFVTNLDWLLPDEIINNPQSKNITLFWRLNTNKPANNNLSFKTLIRNCVYLLKKQCSGGRTFKVTPDHSPLLTLK